MLHSAITEWYIFDKIKLTAYCFCVKRSPGPNCWVAYNDADYGGLWGVDNIPISKTFEQCL